MQNLYLENTCRFPKTLTPQKAPEGCLLFRGETGDKPFFLEFTPVDSRILRLRVYENAYEPPLGDAVGEKAPVTAQLSQDDTQSLLKTEDFSLRLTHAPFSLTLENAQGQPVYREQTEDVDSVGEGMQQIPPVGFVETPEGTAAALCPRLHYDEHIYGLGERFGEFDRRGQRIAMWNRDTLGCWDEASYKNIPFYVSSRGYGLFVNSRQKVVFSIGELSNASLYVQTPGTSCEYYFFVGTPAQVVSGFMQLTGPAVLPPDWSFGLWYSTGFQGASREAVMTDARIFREKRIPCDVLHFDCYWLRENMWCDFVWDDAQYPNRQEMLRLLHQDGFKVCLWMNPYVTICTEMYQEGAAQGYFAKNAQGEPYTADLWHGLLPWCAIMDVTNPQACGWFADKLRTVLREGVDVLKTDFGEDIPVDALFSNGCTGAQMRNLYSVLYNELVSSVVKEVTGKALVWGRSGAAGMQKFPVCWSGDPRSCYEGMAGTLRAGLSMAMSGVPFWSHDMGGFYGEIREDVFVRWCQFGLFTSHSRLHGTSDRQPWAYGPRAEAILTHYIRLRYRLMPYILETARQCVREGLPFLRPLVLEHPQDPTVSTIWDEYYFGPALLVAPVFGGDNETRRVYLPEGSWQGLEDGLAYEGGRWHTLKCPLETLPVFWRTDRPLPMDDTKPQWIEEGKDRA